MQRRGPAQRQLRHAFPQQPHQADAEAREQRDVQSGNRDEMRDAGCARDRPFVGTHRVLIAERECAEQIGADVAVECGRNCGDDARAQCIDADGAVELFVVGRIADGADGDDAVFERISLRIESAGIDRAARTLELHVQTPAFARTDLGRRFVPAEANQSRQCDGRFVARCRIDDEFEACRVVANLRQIVNACR